MIHSLKKYILLLPISLLLASCSITPTPITQYEREEQLKSDLDHLFSSSFSVNQALTIEQAIAHALKYNINQQLKSLDIAIADKRKTLSTYQQLPSLVVNPEYVERDRKPKFDQDTYQTTADLSMAWNVLDFGISYIQSRQNSNQVLISRERRQAAANRIIKDTRRFFWRTIAAEKLATVIKPLEKKLKIALKNSQEAESRRLQSPILLLDFQKNLLEILNQLKQLQKDLSVAKINLARILHVNLGSNFQLVIPPHDYDVENFKLPQIEYMEKYALLNRPELYENDYQRKIQADETRKAMLRFLPGLEFNVSGNYDSGDTYINNSWAEAGLKLTWNIMSLFSAPQKLKLLESQEELHELKSLALNMTIISQVHIAYRHFHEAQGNYDIAKHLNNVSQRIYQHASAGRQAAELSELELIRREADSVLYRVRKHMAYAELQDAGGELYASMGASLLPENYYNLSLNQLSNAIALQTKKWQSENIIENGEGSQSGWIVTKKYAPIKANNSNSSQSE